MQASKALTETRVPHQVTARVARSVVRYMPAEPDAPNSAANGAPADPPAPLAATTATPPAEPPADPRHADPKYWQQRFDVTSGILARERELRQSEHVGLNSRITELQTEVQALKQAVPPAEIDPHTLFSQEEIDAYGEEQCRVMTRAAMKAAAQEAKKLIDVAVQPLRQKAETEATNDAATRKQRFVDQLTELVPDWQVTDKDPRWNDEQTGWLAQEDEHGAVRQDILNAHIQRGNAKGAAKMFQAFVKTIAVPVPPVAPSGSGAGAGEGAPPPAAGLTAPTDAEVKDYYKRSALNKVKEPERVSFEARLKLRNPAR